LTSPADCNKFPFKPRQVFLTLIDHTINFPGFPLSSGCRSLPLQVLKADGENRRKP
jgi:hypothetical protein